MSASLTSPASAESTPDTLSDVKTAVQFCFNAVNGQSYRIESSPDLGGWEVVEEGIAGNGGVITRFYETESPRKKFFRARRE